MQDVGSVLRAERERQGRTLEEVYRATHITLRYLSALENGAFAEIPGEVYRKGFLRRYAQYLGLDAEDLVRRYQESQTPATEVPPAPGAGERPRPERRHSHSEPAGTSRWPVRPLLAAVFVMAAAIATGWALAIWSVQPPAAEPPRSPESSSVSQPAEEPQDEPEDPASSETRATDVLEEPAAAESQNEAATAAETQDEAPPAAAPVASAPVNVEVRLSESCWFRVISDGRLVYEGTLPPGSSAAWTAQERLSVRIGNPPGVRLRWNGQEVDLKSRDPVERLFTRDEVIVPARRRPAERPAPVAVPVGDMKPTPETEPAAGPVPSASPPAPEDGQPTL